MFQEDRHVSLFFLFITIILFSVACSSSPIAAAKCPHADIWYVSMKDNSGGNREGVFSIRNDGMDDIRLAVESGPPYVLHGRFSSADEKEIGGDWRPYNPILEELIGPKGYMVVRRGEIQSFSYDANGLFLPGQSDSRALYSIVVRSAADCIYRSKEFDLSVQAARKP